jgi:hypothetical protein
MKTCNLTWSFGGRNQKCVHNFSRETVGYFYLNYERDGRVVLNVIESDNTINRILQK